MKVIKILFIPLLLIFLGLFTFFISLNKIKISVGYSSFGCIISFNDDFEEMFVYKGRLKSKNSFYRIDYDDGSFIEDSTNNEFPEPSFINLNGENENKSFSKKLNKESQQQLKYFIRNIILDLLFSKILISPEASFYEDPIRINIFILGINFNFLIDGGYVYNNKLDRAKNVEKLYFYLKEISPIPIDVGSERFNGEISGSAINGISKNNPKAQKYMDAAKSEFIDK